jgi:hypothetical protein
MGAVHSREGTSAVYSRGNGSVETSAVLSRNGRIVQDRYTAPTAPFRRRYATVAVGIFGARIIDRIVGPDGA